MMTAIIISGLFFLAGAIFIQGWRKIKADPPHKGAETRFGERTGKILDEGWHWFLLFPYFRSFVSVNITTKDQELPAQKVRTPDMAESSLPGNISWTPDNLVNYLNSGGETGVREKIKNIWEGIIREWAVAEQEGPQTYMQLLASQEEATDILLKAMVPNSVLRINSSIPTAILLKYFRIPPKKPTFHEEKNWGKNWSQVKKIINQERPTDNEKEELKKEIEQRREFIKKVRQGRGEFKKPTWGIIINLLNIGQAEPLGKLAEAMELEAKEEREKAAEKVELEHVAIRIKKLMELGFSLEQALEIIQTERGKVIKTIVENKINLSQAVIEMVEKNLPGFWNTVEKLFGKEESKHG